MRWAVCRSWLPKLDTRKMGEDKKYLTVLANVAVYAAVACGILFLVHTVFFCAVPTYRAIYPYLDGNLLNRIL